MKFTHLLYADGSLVFCDAEVEQIRHPRAILTIFEALSSLHVTGVSHRSAYSSLKGCQQGLLPTKYLGMPLGTKSKSCDIRNEVMERCDKKLARWKTQYLSLGERLTLIYSVLDALLTYMMSLFPIPSNVEDMIAFFFFGSSKRFHWF